MRRHETTVGGASAWASLWKLTAMSRLTVDVFEQWNAEEEPVRVFSVHVEEGLGFYLRDYGSLGEEHPGAVATVAASVFGEAARIEDFESVEAINAEGVS